MMTIRRRSLLQGLSCAAILAPLASARAQSGAPAGAPIRVGSTLPLTGPLAAAGQSHKLAGEIFIEDINARGGLLGRPLAWVLLDDQSQPANTRTQYERLITSDKVDLIMGPYGTSSILAAMGVAQRYNKLFIQSTLGDPSLGSYEWQFPSLPQGPDPRKADTEILLDAFAATKTPPKTLAIVSSKFPAALDLATGAKEVAAARGMPVVLSVEYEFGTKDYGPIAARVKDANPDLLWMGALGLEASSFLEAAKRLDYVPARHFYLFPAPGPMIASASAEGATSLTWFEEHEPFLANKGARNLVAKFNERAKAGQFAYAHTDHQAATEYAAWQILEAAAVATGGLNDKAMAGWLKTAAVDTVLGRQTFAGPYNSGPIGTTIKQAQGGTWRAVWPPERREPGIVLNAP